MMAKEKQTFSAQDIEPPDFSSVSGVYSNSANLIVTNWDIRMLFGEIVPAPGGHRLHIAPRASVVMSPYHFKAFVEMLVNNLAQFEESHGQIKWEPAKQNQEK